MEYLPPPAGAAVSVAEFKRSVHIRDEDVDDDAEFSALLAEAEDMITRATGHVLMPQRVAFTVPVTGWRTWWVPVLPVTGLVKLETSKRGAAWADAGILNAAILRGVDEPQIYLPETWAGWGADPDMIRVTLDVGHEDSKPVRLLRAIKLQAKEWFEAGIAVEDAPQTQLYFGVRRLIRQSRYQRPCIYGS